MEAMRAKDRDIPANAVDTMPVSNVLAAAGILPKPPVPVADAVAIPAGSIRAGVLVVAPPHLVMQWVAELRRMGFVDGPGGATNRPTFLRYYDMPRKPPPKTKRNSAKKPTTVKGEADDGSAVKGAVPWDKSLAITEFAYGTYRVVLTSFKKFSDVGSILVDPR